MDDYKLKSKLGEGGMGQVYRAIQVNLNRPVAIKMLGHDQSGMPDMAARFLREAQLLCSISHPNIVPVFDTGSLGDRPFFAMALVEGPSLAEQIDECGPLEVERVVPMLHQLADALAYLHERGIFHRDIKPRNMILGKKDDQDQVVLVDFGLAKSATSRPLTEAGEIIGTMHYMAPEVFSSGVQEGPQDVWALAISGHFLLTGLRAFSGATFAEVTQQVTNCDPAKVAGTISRSAPGWLRRLIRDCLDRDPAKRPTMSAIRDLLGSGASGLGLPGFAHHDPIAPDPDPGTPSPGRSRATAAVPPPGGALGKMLVTAAASVGVLAIALTAWSFARKAAPTRVAASMAPVAAPPVTPVTFSSFPLREFLCLPSDTMVLVDFEVTEPVDLVISITSTEGSPIHRTHKHPRDQKYFRKFIEPLPKDREFLLQVKTSDGVPLIPGYPLRTFGEKFTKERDSELLGLRGSDLTLPMGLDSMRIYSDPAALDDIAGLVQRFGLARFSKKDVDRLSHLAGTMKDPGLAAKLLDSNEPRVVRSSALRAAVAARVPAALERARQWLPGVGTDHSMLEACAVALGREGRDDSGARLASVMEATWLWTPDSLDAMIACGREAARACFVRWLEMGPVQSTIRMAGLLGLVLGGQDADLEKLRKVLDDPEQGIARAVAGIFLADRSGTKAASTLRHCLEKGHREPSLLWGAARAGVSLPDPPATLPGKDDGTILAWLHGPGLQASGLPAELALRRRLLESPVAWQRDLAAGMLGDWKDAASLAALSKLAESPLDAQGVAAFAAAQVAGSRAPASIVSGFLALASDPDKAPVARLVHLMWAAHTVDPQRARPAVQALAAREGPPHVVGELARHLMIEMPASNVQQIWILPHATYRRTGIRLQPGQAIRARVWGFHESREKPSTWTRFVDRQHYRETGPSYGLSLHHRGKQWFLKREWQTFLAVEEGDLLLTPCLRSPMGMEGPLDRFLPGLVRLEVERSIEKVEAAWSRSDDSP